MHHHVPRHRIHLLVVVVAAGWLQEKAKYDSVAAGLETEKLALERAADAAQNDAVSEESRMHMLNAQAEAASALLDRAREEAQYERGEGRYIRDFKTIKELYTQKLSQLEVLAKELRKKQKDIKENAGAHAAQRTKFVDLKRLLSAKVGIYKADPTGGLGNGGMVMDGGYGSDGGGGSGYGSDSKTMLDGHSGGGGGGGYGGYGGGMHAGYGSYDLGSANVMTITQ